MIPELTTHKSHYHPHPNNQALAAVSELLTTTHNTPIRKLARGLLL